MRPYLFGSLGWLGVDLSQVPALSRSSAVAVFKAEDVIQSVADALQYISYYHPPDYIANLARAYELEESERRAMRWRRS